MAVVQFFKVNTLPNTLEPDSIYYVALSGGLYADTYVTDAMGVARSAGVSLIDSRVTTALSQWSVAQAEVVADIAARNTYIAGLEVNKLVLVANATADPLVGSGSALYLYEHGAAASPGGGTVHLVPGFNGVNVSIAWSAITGGPAATPSAIDAAVGVAHSHSNAATLNKLGEASGALTFDGTPVGGGAGGPPQWDTADW